jgi:hypothetical protein
MAACVGQRPQVGTLCAYGTLEATTVALALSVGGGNFGHDGQSGHEAPSD